MPFFRISTRLCGRKLDSAMDWMTFVVKIIEAVAFPASIFGAGYVFRYEARAMLQRLTKVEYKNLNLSFSDGVTKISREAKGLVEEKSDKTVLGRISEVAGHDRTAAIFLVWKELEIALREALQTIGQDGRRSASNPMRMIDLLVEAKAIDDETAHVLRGLRKLRNVAAHASDYDISKDKTDDYIKLSLSLVESLKLVAGKK